MQLEHTKEFLSQSNVTFLSQTMTNASDTNTDPDNPYSIASFICGCVIIPIAIMGIVGNSFTIYIFNRPSMSSSINFLLSGLAIIDTVLLIIGTPLFSSLAISSYSSNSILHLLNYLTIALYPIAMIAQTASVWIMVLITLERYLAVCWPFQARLFCSMKHAKRALIWVVVFSICYNLVRFWEFEFDPVENSLRPLLKSSLLYLRVYSHWMYFVVIFLLPFLVLLIFNVLVVRTIRNARQNRAQMSRQQCREHNTAFMMIILVLIFFFCNVLAFVLNAIESMMPMEICNSIDSTNFTTQHTVNTDNIQCASDRPLFFLFLEDLNNLLIELNSSINFFIYFSFSNRFRSNFKKIFTRVKLTRATSQTESQASFYSHTSYVPLNVLEAVEKNYQATDPNW